MSEETNKSAKGTLEGWKEIATFLKRDVRTVMRWEKGEGLPIRRHLHNQRSSVYALPSELNAWLAARAPQPLPQKVEWWRPRPALGLAAAIFLLMFSFRGGPLAELQAQAEGRPAPTVTEVYPELGLDGMGMVSSDGKRYVGTDWNRGTLSVWDLASGKSTSLTAYTNWTTYVQFPRWSPDGGKIAYQFCSYNNSAYSNGCRLSVIKAAGGEPEISYKPDQSDIYEVMDWSPDGKTILCGLKGTNGKFVLAAFDVAAQRLSPLREFDQPTPVIMAAQFSPDGKSIAHVAGKLGAARIGLLSLTTGVDTLVAGGGASDRAPAWTKDGKQLLFVSDRSGRWDVWSTDVADGKPVGSPRLAYADIGDVLEFNGWHDDGLLYSKSTATGNFFTVAIDPASATVGEGQAPVPYLVGQHRFGRLSPDGNSIVVNVVRKGFFVYTRSTNTWRPIEVPKDVVMFVPGWYPTGDAIGFWSTSGHGGGSLYRVSLTGKTEEIHTDSAAFGPAQLSSDATILTYVRNVDPQGKSKIYNSVCIYDLTRHRVVKEIVAPAATLFSAPRPSADGKWVVYNEFPANGNGPRRVWIAPVAAGEPRVALEFEPGISPVTEAVSPDGKYLLYATRSATMPPPSGTPSPRPEVFLVRTDGSKPQPLNFPANYHGGFMFWSNDGKQITYVGGESKQQFFTLSNFLPQDGARAGQ